MNQRHISLVAEVALRLEPVEVARRTGDGVVIRLGRCRRGA